MKMCAFSGCMRLDGHGSTVPHAAWDKLTESWVPLAEQRTPAQIMTERRERINHEKAERIASQIMCDDSPGGPYLSLSGDDLREAITAAALAALTEKEKP